MSRELVRGGSGGVKRWLKKKVEGKGVKKSACVTTLQQSKTTT
jgi:hypothetical protein